MELDLKKILSSFAIFAAWAYALGWIKTLYYFRAFGVGLESVEFSPQDYLFASWYVVENVLFFVFLLAIAAVARRAWIFLIVLLYLPLPYFQELSYSHLDSPAWGWFITWFVTVPHSILKFVPFLLLLVVLARKESRARFENFVWPKNNLAVIVLAILAVAWSVSAAKHFGGADADEVLRAPAKALLQVKLRVSDVAPDLKSLESQPSLYLLYFSTHRCILLDTSRMDASNADASRPAFAQPDARLGVLYVSPDKVQLLSGLRLIQLNPGHLFW